MYLCADSSAALVDVCVDTQAHPAQLPRLCNQGMESWVLRSGKSAAEIEKDFDLKSIDGRFPTQVLRGRWAVSCPSDLRQ